MGLHSRTLWVVLVVLVVSAVLFLADCKRAKPTPVAPVGGAPPGAPAARTPQAPVGQATPTPPPKPVVTSEQLVGDALKKGEINYEASLLYRAYAAFGDPHLPAQFQAEAIDLHSFTFLSRELLANEGKLSPETLRQLRPFTLRPTDPESVWAQRLESAPSSATGHALAAPLPQRAKWESRPAAGGKVRVWINTKSLNTIEGKKPKVEHWTGKEKVTYCLDKEDEKVREFILILSNAKRDGTPSGEIKVEPSSKPCGEWAGTITYERTGSLTMAQSAEDGSMQWTANTRLGWTASLEFEAKKLPPMFVPPGVTLPPGQTVPGVFGPTSGSVSVFFQGQNNIVSVSSPKSKNPDEKWPTCTVTDSGTTALNESINLPDQRIEITLLIEGDKWSLTAYGQGQGGMTTGQHSNDCASQDNRSSSGPVRWDITFSSFSPSGTVAKDSIHYSQVRDCDSGSMGPMQQTCQERITVDLQRRERRDNQ